MLDDQLPRPQQPEPPKDLRSGQLLFLGSDQLAWLKRGLLNSRATWKVIASDMPLSIIVYDDAANKKGSEAFAQGEQAPRAGPRTR